MNRLLLGSALLMGAAHVFAASTLDMYLMQVRFKVQAHALYPHSSLAHGEEGVATVFVKVARSGELEDVKIQKSSGFPKLDEAAISAVHASVPFPGVPADVAPGAVSLQVVFPLTFSIQ